jgi:hypothetical protein
MARPYELIEMYQQCTINGVGRTTWPFDPAPRRNPLIVQNTFGLIEKLMADDDLMEQLLENEEQLQAFLEKMEY